MRKLLLVNIGAAVACGGGAVGIAYAITHKFQEAKKTTVADINNIFKNIQTLYGNQSNLQAITDSNYNSLYAFIQQSIAGTVASITTSTDKKLELQRVELLKQLDELKKAFDAHAQFDNDSFAEIYTAIANLNSKLDGIQSIQSAFETKFESLKADYKATAVDLWAGIAGLKNYVDSINATNLGKFDDLNSTVAAIQHKLLQVDELRSMVLSSEEDIHRIQDRLTALEANITALSDKTGYDIATLQASIAALTTAESGLDTKINAIQTAINDIWGHFSVIYSEVDKLKGKQDITNADLATIKDQLVEIIKIQNSTSQQQLDLLTQFALINSKVDSLFVKNDLLQQQVDYLDSQNTQLYQNFLYLQSAINDLEQKYGTGNSTTVSIKPDANDPRYLIYEKSQTNQNGTIKYPSIDVPKLNTAKRFAIYIKVTNTSTNTSYITQVIDAYPDYDYKLIGSSTQGFNNEQFLVSVGLDKNVDKINVNGLWVRKSSDAWKTSKDIDNTKVQITNVVVTY